MNFPIIRSHFEQLQNYFTSVLHRFGNSCPSQRCQVHPEIGSDKSLEFIDLGSKRIVRIIHIRPNSWSHYHNTATTAVREKSNEERRGHMYLDISSEEYWFTRANRPYKQCDDCSRNPRPWGNNNFAEDRDVGRELSEIGNNQLKVLVAGSLGDVGNISAKSIDTYADSLSREVIDSVFHSIFNKFSGFDSFMSISPLKKIITPTHASDGARTSNNDEFHQEMNQETERLNVYPSSRQCKSGIINLSFSGSLSEPDEITSCSNDYQQVYDAALASSSPVQYKFEVSNSRNGRSLDAVSGINKYSGDATDEAAASSDNHMDGHVKDRPYASKEVCGDESLIQSGHEDQSINPVTTSHLNVHETKTQVLNDKGRVGTEGCVHNKNTQNPLLLFLHGVGSSADVWSVMLEYFSAAGYEVLAPDMLGHGYSSAPNNRAAYTFERLLQDVLQIFDRYVSENQKCVAIGHSYGSCFAAALARYRPQQISQLVLLSSGGPSPLVPKQTLFSLHPCIVSLMRPFLMCGFKREVFYAPRGKQLPSFCTYELPPYVMTHVERGQEWSDGDSAFHRRILVPTLLVHGLKDPHISLVEECEMERTIPRSFLEVLPNAGHMQMLDAPEQLCHMIHCFITWWNS